MVCIYCGAPTQVSNSRLQKRPNHVWRRRVCTGCGAIFTTEESAALHASLMVARQGNSQLTPFSRDQLFASVHDSCRHRPRAIADATALTHTIIVELMHTQQNGLIALQDIARITHMVLSRFDQAAATMYAAYHSGATSVTS